MEFHAESTQKLAGVYPLNPLHHQNVWISQCIACLDDTHGMPLKSPRNLSLVTLSKIEVHKTTQVQRGTAQTGCSNLALDDAGKTPQITALSRQYRVPLLISKIWKRRAAQP